MSKVNKEDYDRVIKVFIPQWKCQCPYCGKIVGEGAKELCDLCFDEEIFAMKFG